MERSISMLMRSEGISLVELLVALLLGSVVVIMTLAILKNSYGIAGKVKTSIDNTVYVREFLRSLNEEVLTAGYADLTRSKKNGSAEQGCKSICLSVDNNPMLQIKTELIDNDDYRVVQRIEYKTRQIISRSQAHPNELGIYKRKVLDGEDAFGFGENSFSLALAGVKSFTCSAEDIIKNGESFRKNSKVLKCQLEVYRSMTSNLTDTFNFYAKNEN